MLFCDLVGFTSRAERLDVEDVRGLLSSYYARLRIDLERYGATVEKFIGDAVMALFGAPSAHEDDLSGPCGQALRSTRRSRRSTRPTDPGPARAHRGDHRGSAGRPGRQPRGHGLWRRGQHRGPAAGGGPGRRHPGRRDHLAGDRAGEYRPAAPVAARNFDPVPAWQVVAPAAYVVDVDDAPATPWSAGA